MILAILAALMGLVVWLELSLLFPTSNAGYFVMFWFGGLVYFMLHKPQKYLGGLLQWVIYLDLKRD